MAFHIFSVDKENLKCSSFYCSYLRYGSFVGLADSGASKVERNIG